MGAEGGQLLSDIIRRKDLERECGDGVFAWGIGNSVGSAIKHAKYAEQVADLEALFSPMKSAPRAIDSAPASIVMWLGFHFGSEVGPLPEHMLVTSRGEYGSGEEKRGHYALICRSSSSLAARPVQHRIDHRAVRNLVSSNPVGSSQVTSVVRYQSVDSQNAVYPVLFRAKLLDQAFVKLAVPVLLTRELSGLYRALCASQTPQEWRSGIRALKGAVRPQWPQAPQSSLFAGALG